jgi:hypothetical protein
MNYIDYDSSQLYGEYTPPPTQKNETSLRLKEIEEELRGKTSIQDTFNLNALKPDTTRVADKMRSYMTAEPKTDCSRCHELHREIKLKIDFIIYMLIFITVFLLVKSTNPVNHVVPAMPTVS